MEIYNYIKDCDLCCNKCKTKSNICEKVNYLYSKEKALDHKHKIYSKRRNYNPITPIEYDLMFELYIADNITSTPQKILKNYNHIDDYQYDASAVQKVNRIKRKIKKLYTENDKSFIKCFLDKADTKSFSCDELDLYVEAIKYLSKSQSFKMSYIDHPHKYNVFTGNWFELNNFLNHNQGIYRGNSLCFLASFCKSNNKKRNLCNRLFIDLGEKSCFSKGDVDYILKQLSPLNYTKEMFFKHLELIKTFR